MRSPNVAMVAAVFFCVFAAVSVNAAIIVTTHTTLASFNATAGPTLLENLNGATPEADFASKSFTDFTVTRTNLDPILSLLAGGDANNFDGTNFLKFIAPGGAFDEGANFTFASPISAFGFDYKNLDSSFDVIDLVIDGQSFAVAQPGTTGFFGITTDLSFTDVEIIQATGGDLIPGAYFDDVRYTVPEPSSFAFLGLILGGLALRRSGPLRRSL